MDMTKYIVEKMREDFNAGGVLVVPVYDIKTVDVKRDNFLTVYTDNRQIKPAGLGGMSWFEDVSLIFDFRGGEYDEYYWAKQKLKAWLEKYVRGTNEMGFYNFDMMREDELSDKQRGMYRFLLHVVLYRILDYRNEMVFFDNFEIYGMSGVNRVYDCDFELNGASWVVQYSDDFEEAS